MIVMEQQYNEAVTAIKQAILQSQYRSVKLITGEQLSLYFGIGRYVSANSRTGTWGTGAIEERTAWLAWILRTEHTQYAHFCRILGDVSKMLAIGERIATSCH